MKNSKESLFGTGMEVFLGLALLLGLLLPHTNTILMLVNPILCAVLLLAKGKQWCIYGIAPIFTIILSLILSVVGDVTSKSLLMAAFIMLCIITFPMAKNERLKNVYLYICFGAIFVSQVAYMFDLTFISQFVDRYYPITWGEDFIARTNEDVNLTNYLSYRQGGLFRNPNHLAKYVTFLLAIFLVNNNDMPIIKQLWFTALCFFSIILTGSRTGFVVSGILIMLALFRNRRSSKLGRVFVTIAVLGLMLYYFLSGMGGRSTAVSEGVHDSMGLKFWLVIDYLTHETSPLYLMFGHLDYTLFEGSYYTTYNLDCEYGYIIYCFGFLGFFAFIYYLYKLYNHVDKSYRLFFVVCLWMITSSIFMSYRAIFVFMLLLSTIYNKRPCSNSDYQRTEVR